ncbi:MULTISPECIES: membrane protein [Amycolatopsis]|uniref:Integral membrane protein DUF2269 n=1 Tax=Amycolatopsis echigonensis TaxID=2576905 RepID=A0A2N3WMW8_9PSEU|nr:MULTISPECIES: membrane protein [Amycolatopsis]MBB2504864.1 hypothetical protein [Amycolatopsis echigonensis]PKV95216.1 hypothetical protein ATK30_6121 [Amycolatopsis niigatensis]
MNAFLLSVHVLAAILAIGPVAVAASMFPSAARLASDDPKKAATVQILHRTTRVYAVLGALVPVFGLATGARIGVLGNAWLIVSLVLTVAAAGILVGVVLPGQKRIVDALGSDRPAPVRLAMPTGIFNLLWAAVVVLMIYRPGSTTGVGL